MNNDLYLKFFIYGVQGKEKIVILFHGQYEYMKWFKLFRRIHFKHITFDPYKNSKRIWTWI